MKEHLRHIDNAKVFLTKGKFEMTIKEFQVLALTLNGLDALREELSTPVKEKKKKAKEVENGDN